MTISTNVAILNTEIKLIKANINVLKSQCNFSSAGAVDQALSSSSRTSP